MEKVSESNHLNKCCGGNLEPSLGHIHNETVNIYTHLIGGVVAVIASAVVYQALAPRYDSANFEDVIVFACFFAGAAACLGMSATFHTISNHSRDVAKWGNQLDYLGIVLLIWGSFIPSIYYGFHQDVALIRTYWTMVRFTQCECSIYRHH